MVDDCKQITWNLCNNKCKYVDVHFWGWLRPVMLANTLLNVKTPTYAITGLFNIKAKEPIQS